MSRWLINFFYRLDPVFRSWVDRKTSAGPDDRVGAGESVVCVMRDASTEVVRMRQVKDLKGTVVKWGNSQGGVR